MRVQNNIMSMNAYRNYNNNTGALSKNLEKLSSGYRINRAGDDAAGLAISEKMRAQITGLATAQDNAQAGINMIQTAEGALTEVHDMLNRMYELANQAVNGTYDDTNRSKIDAEVDQLTQEITRIAQQTKFNDQDLLSTANKSFTLQIGSESGQTMVVNMGAKSMTADGLAVDTVDVSTSTGATAAMTAIKTAIESVSVVRGNLGAYQNRLEHTIKNLSVTEENIQAAESSIRDTDVAEEMMAYTKNNILIQSAQAMLAQANQVPQGVLQLLQ